MNNVSEQKIPFVVAMELREKNMKDKIKIKKSSPLFFMIKKLNDQYEAFYCLFLLIRYLYIFVRAHFSNAKHNTALY